jgi:hypothetical protein
LEVCEVAENTFRCLFIKNGRTEFTATPISTDKISRDEFEDTEPRWNLIGIFTQSALNTFSPKEKRGGTVEKITTIFVELKGGQDVNIYKVDIDVPWKTVARYTGRFFRKGYDTRINGKHPDLKFTPSINSEGESVFVLPQKIKESADPKISMKEKIEIFFKQ